MISHLSYCITHNNKIGYGNLVPTVFKKCITKLTASPSFDLEPENYFTRDTLSRLSLRVQGAKVEYDVEEPKVKGDIGV